MAESKVEKLNTKADFEAALKKGKVAVDFYADWCGPCRMISPKFIEFANQFADIVFCKVDVDENNEVAESQGISAMPTFKFYHNGEVAFEPVVGASEAKIKDALVKLSGM